MVYNKILDDFKVGKGLELWKESSIEYEKRKKSISDFILKLSKPNEKVKKSPKKVNRKAIFDSGDCLSVSVNNGYYGAALVVKTDNTNEEYGKNLILTLDYWDIKPPQIEEFASMKNLIMPNGYNKGEIHNSWFTTWGFRNYRDKIVKIGNIDVRKFACIKSRSYATSWVTLIKDIERAKMKT